MTVLAILELVLVVAALFLARLTYKQYQWQRKFNHYQARVDEFLLRLAKYPRMNDPKLTSRMNARGNHAVARSAALQRFSDEAMDLVGDIDPGRDPRNPGQEEMRG